MQSFPYVKKYSIHKEVKGLPNWEIIEMQEIIYAKRILNQDKFSVTKSKNGHEDYFFSYRGVQSLVRFKIGVSSNFGIGWDMKIFSQKNKILEEIASELGLSS